MTANGDRKKLHEGKAKIVWDAGDGTYVVEYKDDATAFDGKKKGQIRDKGRCNNLISAALFELLEREGIPTHYVRTLSDREMVATPVEIIQVEVVVRNVAAGSLAKRLGLDEGTPVSPPVLELYYKSDPLGDPMINRYHIKSLGLATEAEMDRIEALALRVNDILTRAMADCDLRLIDFKLEFGRARDGRILLADEISPDTCRFWDVATGEKLDKDRFRRDMGGVEDAYEEVLRRVTAAAGNWEKEGVSGSSPASGAGLPTASRPGGSFSTSTGRAVARVYVTLKKSVLDPQGAAVESALKTLGYDEVAGARVGKFIVLELDQASPERVEEMSRRLLANPVIEDFTFEIG